MGKRKPDMAERVARKLVRLKKRRTGGRVIGYTIHIGPFEVAWHSYEFEAQQIFDSAIATVVAALRKAGVK